MPGAVYDENDTSVSHYGSPLLEARNFEHGNAVVVRTDLAVLQLQGSDCHKILNALTSNQISHTDSASSLETLILSPQGKIEEQLAALSLSEQQVLLTVPHNRAGAVIRFFERMRFTLDFTVTDISAQYLLCDICIPTNSGTPLKSPAQAALFSVCGDPLAQWQDPWNNPPGAGGYQYYAADHAAHPAVTAPKLLRLFFDLAKLSDLSAAARNGALKLAGLNAVKGYEISVFKPGYPDYDERSLPHEYDLLRSSIHLQKGCYRGQESVAKIHNLGHPPRRLVFLHLDGSETKLPAKGDKIYAAPECAGQKPIGIITRAVIHHELGPIALALVKRTAPADIATYFVQLAADNSVIAASPEVIVPPAAGATQALSPEERRAFMRRG